MPPRRRSGNFQTSGNLLKVFSAFLMVGGLLFFNVWWPIQAHRANKSLIHIQKDLTSKKIQLNFLQAEYSNLISLTSIDQWAKNNGRWINPTHRNVITIQN